MLKEMRESMVILSVPKWKKDILLLLLMKSNETYPYSKKALRREADRDLNKIIEKWSTLE
jgi:hypothetical protein